MNYNFKQRTVNAHITGYQKETNSFLGTLCLKSGQSIQANLIQSGYLFTDKLNQNLIKEEWLPLEEEAKKTGVNIWSKEFKEFAPVDPLDALEDEFKAKISDV